MGASNRLELVGAVYQACRLDDRLFAMNPYLSQQNFYAQQLRALALVEALNELHLRPGHRNVLVVGAGVAGRTLAAAFATVGASVRLVECRSQPFERYRDAIHRELHPNIIFWPEQEPIPATALPFLNWAQASAKEVVENINEEWEAGFAKKVELFPGEVTSVISNADFVEVELKQGGRLVADLCVLAMGFKTERRLGDAKSPSYWSPSSVADDERSVLVSGSGDGGLIDVLSPILGTDVTRAAHRLAVALRDSSLKEDIAKIEALRESRRIAGTRDSTDDCIFYATAPIPPEATLQLDALCRSEQALEGRKVTFLYQTTSPYSYTAAPINKLLLGRFSSAGKPYIKSVKGALTLLGTQRVMQCADGTCQDLDAPDGFEKVMVRHGADPGVADVLSGDQLATLHAQSDEYSKAAKVDGYNSSAFNWHQGGVGKSGVRPSMMPKVIRRNLAQVGKVYSIELGPIAVTSQALTGERSIEVDLSEADEEKARDLRLFPLRVGPTIVEIKKLKFERNRPDVE